MVSLADGGSRHWGLNMLGSDTARVRTEDRLLEDAVRDSPVDLEQQAIHRKLLYLAVPWLYLVAPPWVLGSVVASWAKH
jgi:hypothetical protein